MTPRTIADFEALRGDAALTAAERKLIAACRAGEACVLSDNRPTQAGPDNIIRASLLRLLITGGTADCGLHETGVCLLGGWIVGRLDLSFTRARGRTILGKCHFAEKPRMEQAELQFLSLKDSHLPGLWAPGFKVTRSLFLRKVTIRGTVDMNGADIGGQLACNDATFYGKDGEAFRALGVKVGESLFLTKVKTSGSVTVAGADIGGLLSCEGATFDGKGGMALHAQRLRVAQGFIWRGLKGVTGTVSLNGAHVGDLVDDMASWPTAPDSLILDGFTYDRIADGPTDATARLPWLRSGANFNGTFYPQSYTQLAKVLWEMGHTQQARRVLIERTRLLGRQIRRERAIPPDGTIHMAFRSLWSDIRNTAHGVGDWFVYQVTGYGHRPVNALLWLIGLWAFAWFLAAQVWNEGSFAPNSDVVLVSQSWIDATDADCIGPLLRPPPTGLEPCDPNPANTWSAKAAPGMDWDSFSARGYALDLVVPILTLGQTDAWAPSKDRGWWGWTLWWGRWAFEVFGWVITALGAAAITGIIQRGRE